MSYDPSQAQGTRAVQIDLNGTTTLSNDISAHTNSGFTSRNKYFVESKYFVTVNGSVAGLIRWYNWTGYSWAGGTLRCNAVSRTSTMTDDSWLGANVQGTPLAMQVTSAGTETVSSANSQMITQMWRIQ